MAAPQTQVPCQCAECHNVHLGPTNGVVAQPLVTAPSLSVAALNGTVGWLPLALVPGPLPRVLQLAASVTTTAAPLPPRRLPFLGLQVPPAPPAVVGAVANSPASSDAKSPTGQRLPTGAETPVVRVEPGPPAPNARPLPALSAADLRVPVSTYRMSRLTATQQVRQALARSAERVFRPESKDGVPWKCPFAGCDKAYRNPQALEVHYRKHTEHAFVCKDCGKTFARRRNFVEHLRVHTGERPFRCNLCPKAFKQPHSLTDHMRTHTGDKPFVCDLCGRAFAVKHNMKTHRELHLGRKEFPCPYCGKVLHTKHGYRGHVASFHLGVQ